MIQSTYKYTISLLLLLIAFSTGAEEKKENFKLKPLSSNGITVQVDVASLFNSILSNGDKYSTEAGFQIDLKNGLHPIVEVGFGGGKKLSEDNIDFKTNGVFGRIGFDINLLKQKKDTKPSNNLFLVGARVGISNFSYDISNILITDDYWGGTEVLNYPNKSAKKAWFEIVAGVRVEVQQNIYMGWTVRSKNLFSQDSDGEISSWYIPGFGLNGSSAWSFYYTLGYHFKLPLLNKNNNK